MHILDPLTLPLNQSNLIEASAGTGKTYTMANLYLRLLLGVGCEPLSVEQILVVTFTKAATQELRDRIRDKIKTVAQLFEQHQQAPSTMLSQDPFLLALYQQVEPNLQEALLRLSIAEQEMDLASIFTIDSFCQKMLFQFAFNSGIRFDIELQADEQKLLQQLCEDTWRELFYPMAQNEAAVVRQELHHPQYVLDEIKAYLYGDLPDLSPTQQQLMRQDLATHLGEYRQFIATAKAFWRENGQQIVELVAQEQKKKYPSGVAKALNRRKLNASHLNSYQQKLTAWATSDEDILPAQWEKFSQANFNLIAEEGAEPLHSPLFVEIEQQAVVYRGNFANKQKPLLLFQFLMRVRQKLADYKQQHREKSFGDILHFLHRALFDEAQGQTLAAQIRRLFPFAMIDEFQDTNQAQYEIFSRIFMPPKVENQGFIMIGDPKQSIYKFRGADIFTYLTAADQVAGKYTLNRNWRSVPAVVQSTNQLFTFPPDSERSPFLYHGIAFYPVESNLRADSLQGEANTQYYLLADYNEKQCAEWCAYQIQQQLKRAEQQQFYRQDADGQHAVQASDIAILVRSHTQATLVRQALLKRHIRSVFYSERNSVYESPEAQDLLFILKAALTPYQPQALLAALGTALWGLDAQTLYQLKNDETEWDSWVEQFVQYQQIWQQHGILPMLHRLFVQHELLARLNSQPNAERRMTDLLHLAELLQEAMADVENEAALVRWYQQQLENPNGLADDQKQRLESEEALVKVITIHGSKGLEYPIVWLPFAAKASQGVKSKALTVYRNHQHRLAWDFGSQSNEVKELINQADYAEDLRLLYVAITRAKYQLNLILPEEFGKQWSAMHYLLSNGETQLPQPTADYLQQKGIECQLHTLTGNIPQDDWQPHSLPQPNGSARLFHGKIIPKGLITSFSALQAQNEFLQNNRSNSPPAIFGDDAQDYDRQFTSAAPLDDPDTPMPYSPYQFPHSTKVGNLLHKLFEQWDFSQPISAEQLISLCEALDLGEQWLAPLQEWFEKISHTPLIPEGLCLNSIHPDKRLNEWQFYLRLKNENALPQLNQLLKQHSRLAKSLPDLQLKQLEGFIRGFVDCIIQWQDKFYLIDYKSNFLGYFVQDYQLERLEKIMTQYRYDLQYLLYTLALHRYLRTRLGSQYQYERDFGGVAYLFLRGMNGSPQSGVFFDKPSVELIEALDQLFG
ncbi:exodeoxyribonuclease V subunit beta [Muribacter muris]|uniref:RecBCD enzyme subunit RecB n=1 Tax=Muribacter muris TaxID=67855 RepID=A0A4Y9K607_9PAST|nr:exodeoxyribonuclease V subunit beta [Muribacter muris]MBF0784553.1 exodeoxyribonuclease V subunit beta [Muribacter muris]MBF0826151.1 exodeoxyribonuclease V subunit beta [Muribacter muris]TFV12065.1 exodeoxyribonuclease V subunit beta [Muribacter muris]